ncbi:50S ribosome-binding GTPase [Paraoerskovia marina]|uniref:50S ribosome-binding GTPase n=1 Tax=Paraoerskovia marina TaxID=545619 RepID=A0A1H1UCH4_9CELL|nr:GTPase domain-containing protein [Paraoerskovia marina]SDS69619.1 50S ribosome-binding GTPase [Paraoerskovia marina]
MTSRDVAPSGTDNEASSRRLETTVHDVAKDLRRVTASTTFPLDLPGSADAAASRDRLVVQLDEHLLPRLKELSSPAIVVIAGSTGAGKSTLYNSLLGEEVSAAGVLRPTTRRPVLSHHPLDEDVLVTGPATRSSRLVAHDAVPRGVALLDAPDLDSLASENREIAGQLLEAADLWLFVTTASRYGDALPWKTLGRARERGASVAVVLNRVSRQNLGTIRADLLQRLRDHGMEKVPLFVVPDVGPHEGLLEPEAVAPISRWLAMLGGPDRSRSVIVRTLKGSLAALPAWVTMLTDAVDAQVAAADTLRADVDGVVPEVQDMARTAITGGVVARGPVSSAWSQGVSGSRVDGVKVKAGTARSSRRRGRAREDALDSVRDSVERAVRRSLVAAGTTAHDAIADRLGGPDASPGATTLAPLLDDAPSREARDRRADDATRSWLDEGDAVVDALLAGGARTEEAAARALGRRGLSTVLLTAAIGSDDALRLADRVLDGGHDEPVGALREALVRRAAEIIDAEAAPLREALDVPDLHDDASVALSVRLAELRRLV